MGGGALYATPPDGVILRPPSSARVKEHKNDVKFHRTSNAIVLHIDECQHLPMWENTTILEKNMKKKNRKIIEAAHILSRNTFNTRNGFMTWASTAAKLAVGGL